MDKRTYNRVAEKTRGFGDDVSSGRIKTNADACYRVTMKTETVGGIYSGTMETVEAGGDVAEMQGDKGRQRTAKGGRCDGMMGR